MADGSDPSGRPHGRCHHLFENRAPLQSWEEILDGDEWRNAYLPYEQEVARTTAVQTPDNTDIYRRFVEVTLMDRNTGLTAEAPVPTTPADRVAAAVAYQQSMREAWQECLLTVTTRNSDRGVGAVYFRVAGQRQDLEPLMAMAESLGLNAALAVLNTTDDLLHYLRERDESTEVSDA